MNIIKILVRLTKKGGEREKLEACKALLNIYKTFEADIQDPLSTIVLPQLDGTFDESDRVRYIFCKNLAKYRIFNHDVIFCLICRLSDHVEKVR